MAGLIDEASAIDPWVCRRYVAEHFVPERMVADYVTAYEEAIARAKKKAKG
jgi:hypothetical protein